MNTGTKGTSGDDMAEKARAELDIMVRDFCKVGPKPKSEVRSRIASFTGSAVRDAVRECANEAQAIIGSVANLTEEGPERARFHHLADRVASALRKKWESQ